MRTLVINLARRADRWAAASARLAAHEDSGLLAVERFVATDGGAEAECDGAVLRRWSTDRNARYDGRPGYRPGVELTLTPGERGCAMSHLRAWRRVLTSDPGAVVAGAAAEEGAEEGSARAGARAGEPVLILEDDAVLSKSFDRRLRPAIAAAEKAGADVLYLGYIKGAPWRRKVAPGLQEAEYLWTTVAYVLWPSGARRLVEALPVDCPVDNFMAWQMASRKLFALAVTPAMVDQEGEWDFKSDVPHSDDVVLDEAGEEAAGDAADGAAA